MAYYDVASNICRALALGPAAATGVVNRSNNNIAKLISAGLIFPGRVVQIDSIKPSFLELNTTRLINLDRANDVSSHVRAVQADSITTRVESA